MIEGLRARLVASQSELGQARIRIDLLEAQLATYKKVVRELAPKVTRGDLDRRARAW